MAANRDRPWKSDINSKKKNLQLLEKQFLASVHPEMFTGEGADHDAIYILCFIFKIMLQKVRRKYNCNTTLQLLLYVHTRKFHDSHA